MPRALRIIAYDIVCNRRRQRLEKLACTVGERVQDSVFEAWLTETEITAWLRKASRLLEPSEDSLRVYTLCADCCRRARCLGRGHLPRERDDVIV